MIRGVRGYEGVCRQRQGRRPTQSLLVQPPPHLQNRKPTRPGMLFQLMEYWLIRIDLTSIGVDRWEGYVGVGETGLLGGWWETLSRCEAVHPQGTDSRSSTACRDQKRTNGWRFDSDRHAIWSLICFASSGLWENMMRLSVQVDVYFTPLYSCVWSSPSSQPRDTSVKQCDLYISLMGRQRLIFYNIDDWCHNRDDYPPGIAIKPSKSECLISASGYVIGKQSLCYARVLNCYLYILLKPVGGLNPVEIFADCCLYGLIIIECKSSNDE